MFQMTSLRWSDVNRDLSIKKGILRVPQRLFLSFGILLVVVSQGLGQQYSKGHNEEIIDVEFCELASNSARYDNKIVRVRAINYAFYHSTFLYDVGCNNREFFIEVGLDCDSEERCKELRDALDKNVSAFIIKTRATVTVVGTFNILSGGDRQDLKPAFKYKLSIRKVENAIPTPPETQWPQG